MEKLEFEFYPQHLTDGETKQLNSWTMKAGLKSELVKLTVDAHSMVRREMLKRRFQAGSLGHLRIV